MTWYSTGTVKTTANGAVVTGTGTAWTNSGLRPGDMMLIGYSTISPRGYEIKSIDSATQITLVLPFPVAVSGAGYVGIPMLGGDRTAITMTLANQVTKALADTEAMSAVYQTFYTSPGTVSLTLPGGLVISGSSFQKLTDDMANKASLVSGSVPINQGGTGATSAANARSNLGLGYGSLAGTVAQGNDARLNTIEGKTGGGVTGDVIATRPTGSYGVGPTVSSIVYPPGSAAPSVQWQMFSEVNASGRYGHLRLWQDAAFKDWYFDYNSGTAYAPTAWQGNCDVRIKDKITRISNPLERMRKIKGCTWVRKDDQMKGAIGIGLIAQDVLDGFWDIPEVVSYSRQGSLTVDGVEVDAPLSMSNGDVSAALHHEAILALMDKIEALEEKVASLEKGKMG